MGESYCARIADALVANVIVCSSPAWAASVHGGEWVYTGTRLVGIGWPVVDGEIMEPTFDAEPPMV